MRKVKTFFQRLAGDDPSVTKSSERTVANKTSLTENSDLKISIDTYLKNETWDSLNKIELDVVKNTNRSSR